MRKRPYYAVFLSLSLFLMISGATAANSTAEEDDSSSKTVLKELNNATWISDIDWDPENSTKLKVTIHSEIPTRVGMQELPDYTGTEGSFNKMQDFTLQPGENEIYLPVNGRVNYGVSLVPLTGSGEGIYYRKSFFDFLPNVSIPLLFFSGFVGFVLTIAAEYWYVKKTTEKVEKGSGRLI
jgi:hypothetical protein